jgi:hypothetical protein
MRYHGASGTDTKQEWRSDDSQWSSVRWGGTEYLTGVIDPQVLRMSAGGRAKAVHDLYPQLSTSARMSVLSWLSRTMDEPNMTA